LQKTPKKRILLEKSYDISSVISRSIVSMYHTPSVLHRTTSWFHGEIESCLRRCFEHLLDQGASEPHEGRPPEVPDLSLWMALIIGLLRGVRSQRAIWRLLVSGGLWHEPCYDVSDQAIYNRLDRQGSGPLPAFFATLTELLSLWLEPSLQTQGDLLGELAPFAREVVALDESTLDAVTRRLPCLRNVPAGDERLLPGKLVALFDIRQQIHGIVSWSEELDARTQQGQGEHI
jgi:hypothetical protein